VERSKLEQVKARIADLESSLLELLPAAAPEGTNATILGDMKIEVTNKINRTLDADGLDETLAELPPSYQDVVRYKPALNLKRMRELQAHEGDAYGILSKHITAKPGKSTIKITIGE